MNKTYSKKLLTTLLSERNLPSYNRKFYDDIKCDFIVSYSSITGMSNEESVSVGDVFKMLKTFGTSFSPGHPVGRDAANMFDSIINSIISEDYKDNKLTVGILERLLQTFSYREEILALDTKAIAVVLDEYSKLEYPRFLDIIKFCRRCITIGLNPCIAYVILFRECLVYLIIPVYEDPWYNLKKLLTDTISDDMLITRMSPILRMQGDFVRRHHGIVAASPRDIKAPESSAGCLYNLLGDYLDRSISKRLNPRNLDLKDDCLVTYLIALSDAYDLVYDVPKSDCDNYVVGNSPASEKDRSYVICVLEAYRMKLNIGDDADFIQEQKRLMVLYDTTDALELARHIEEDLL